MPTAAKLISALVMALLGWGVAHLVVPHLPPETRIGWFREISAGLGLLVGWRFLGRRAGGGWNLAPGYGLGAAAILVFWMLLVFSGYEMLRRAMRKAYGGDPVAALKDMVQIAMDDAVYLQPFEVWGALVLGGLAAGLIAEAAARRWS